MKAKDRIKQMTSDPRTYLESVGKNDRERLEQYLSEGGARAVIRACLWRN